MNSRSASVTGSVSAATSACESTLRPGRTLRPDGIVTPGPTRASPWTIASRSTTPPSTRALNETNEGHGAAGQSPPIPTLAGPRTDAPCARIAYVPRRTAPFVALTSTESWTLLRCPTAIRCARPSRRAKGAT